MRIILKITGLQWGYPVYIENYQIRWHNVLWFSLTCPWMTLSWFMIFSLLFSSDAGYTYMYIVLSLMKGDWRVWKAYHGTVWAFIKTEKVSLYSIIFNQGYEQHIKLQDIWITCPVTRLNLNIVHMQVYIMSDLGQSQTRKSKSIIMLQV